MENKEIKCSRCSKSFKYNYLLKKHMNSKYICRQNSTVIENEN